MNKKIKLKMVMLLPNVRFDQDKRVYDSNGLARTIKTNGGGNYLVNETERRNTQKRIMHRINK